MKNKKVDKKEEKRKACLLYAEWLFTRKIAKNQRLLADHFPAGRVHGLKLNTGSIQC